MFLILGFFCSITRVYICLNLNLKAKDLVKYDGKLPKVGIYVVPLHILDTAINVAKDFANKAKNHPTAGYREQPPPARGGDASPGDERRFGGSRGNRYSSNVQRNPVGPPSGANGDRKNWGRKTKGGARSPPAVTEVCKCDS